MDLSASCGMFENFVLFTCPRTNRLVLQVWLVKISLMDLLSSGAFGE